VDLREKLKNARSILKTHGLRGLFQHITRRLLWSVRGGEACRIFLYELDTPQPRPEAILAAAGHTFRFATAEEIHALHADPAAEVVDQDLVAFERGARCLLQYDGDALVGYTWLNASPLIHIMWGLHFNLPDDTAYNYKGFTAPAYRGKGFQPLRHLKVLEHIRDQGQRRLFGYVDHLNLNSIRGVRKSGYRKIGVLRCVRKPDRVRFVLKVSSDLWSKTIRT
jgi:GNAT superfamily N-acetyltransferase